MDIPLYIQKSSQNVEGDAKTWIDVFLGFLPSDSTIFEIGSATGRDANYIEGMGFKIIRTDIHQEFVNFQKEKYNKDVLFFDVKNIVLQEDLSKGFGGVFARAVLNHFSISELNQIFLNLKLMLKKEAVFAFNLPNNFLSEDILSLLEKNNYKLLSKFVSEKDSWTYFITSLIKS